MSRHDEDGPVYYREIQKNAYLKRIPEETSGSKLRPLGHKKPPLKPMWTLFCVHNGRVPYLEQYPSIDAPCTASHRPLWRACLRTARHVTASVTPRGTEHDFLIHTDSGPLRLLAPDWESMQDWVTTLRNKLHELKILPKGENVYCAAPVPPAPRAGTRDPTSPLPPTPPVPPDRVPGIELVTPTSRPPPAPEPAPVESEVPPQPLNHSETPAEASYPTADTETTDNIDISDWDTTLKLNSLPSTSQATQSVGNTKKKLKICGQNICLDKFVFNREDVSSDEEGFFAEMDRINCEREGSGDGCASGFVEGPERNTGEPGESLSKESRCVEESGPSSAIVKVDEEGSGEVVSGFTQRLVVGSGGKAAASLAEENEGGAYQSTNITVIQVSNKPPHTAIPVLGPETDIFNFDFKQNVTVSNVETTEASVYTEEMERSNLARNFGVKTSEVRDSTGSKHSVAAKTGAVSDKSNFKRNYAVNTCEMSEKSNFKRNFVAKPSDCMDEAEKYVNVVNTEVNVDNKYGAVFADDKNDADYGHISLTTTVSLSGATSNEENKKDCIYERLCLASTSSVPSPLPLKRLKTQEISRKTSLPNLEIQKQDQNQTYEYLYPGSNANVATQSSKTSMQNNSMATPNDNSKNSQQATPSQGKAKKNHRQENETSVMSADVNSPSVSSTRLNAPASNRGNYVSSVPVSGAIMDANTEVLRSNIERSHSQNVYDNMRIQDRLIRKESSGKNEVKNEGKASQPKPIWKRGLTELSLLSRLRGIGQGKRADSPTRNEGNDRTPSSPLRPSHRSRRDSHEDSGRRRSSSLTNGNPQPQLQSLRAREAASLRVAQASGAALPARVLRVRPPLMAEHDGALWIAWWGSSGAWHGGRSGDRVAALRGRTVAHLHHARTLLASAPAHKIDILFHRVPLAKIYILNKDREDESIGIKLDNDCTISSVEANSPAARAGIPPPGSWAVTECNNRPVNLVKGGQDDLNRLSACGKEVSVLIQPTALVKKLRATMKANKSVLGLR